MALLDIHDRVFEDGVGRNLLHHRSSRLKQVIVNLRFAQGNGKQASLQILRASLVEWQGHDRNEYAARNQAGVCTRLIAEIDALLGFAPSTPPGGPPVVYDRTAPGAAVPPSRRAGPTPPRLGRSYRVAPGAMEVLNDIKLTTPSVPRFATQRSLSSCGIACVAFIRQQYAGSRQGAVSEAQAVNAHFGGDEHTNTYTYVPELIRALEKRSPTDCPSGVACTRVTTTNVGELLGELQGCSVRKPAIVLWQWGSTPTAPAVLHGHGAHWTLCVGPLTRGCEGADARSY